MHLSAGGKLEISKTRGKLENPHFPIRGKLDIHVRVNNEKNGGVKKAPQARGGRPLRSINISSIRSFATFIRYNYMFLGYQNRGNLLFCSRLRESVV